MHGDEGATQPEVLQLPVRRITYIQRLRIERSREYPGRAPGSARTKAGHEANRLTKASAWRGGDAAHHEPGEAGKQT